MSIEIKKKTSFNADSYVQGMKETIMEMYNIDKDTAAHAIATSIGFQDAIRRDPAMAAHIDNEMWASKIWMGYKRKMML